MKRKSLITAISFPKETGLILDKLQNKFHKNRSELLREMINYYVESSVNNKNIKQNQEYIDDSDANKVLKLYYKLISVTKSKPTIVVAVGIVNKKNKVIIGLRKKNDRFVKDLHWTFPSGKIESLNFENEIVKIVERETSLKIKVVQLVHARVFPDSPQKSIRIVVLYYHCKIKSGRQKPGGDFKEIKWVPAAEVHRYFTTSVSDEITAFLGTF